MVAFSNWLCRHRWHGTGDKDAHECGKCGRHAPHEWSFVAHPAAGAAQDESIPAETGSAEGEAQAPVPMRLYLCKICGATKWRKSPRMRLEDYLA